MPACCGWPQQAAEQHTAICSPSPGGVGERIAKVQVPEPTGWDKDSSLGKAQAVHASKAKQSKPRHPFTTSHQRWAFSRCQECGARPAEGFLEKTNAITLNDPLCLPSPTVTAEHDVTQHGASLWSAWVTSPGHVPSQVMVHQLLVLSLVGRAARGAEEPWALCKYCTAAAQPSVCYHHCPRQKSKTQHHTRFCVEN